MKETKEELVKKQLALEADLDKLNDFNQSSEFEHISENEQALLAIQAGAMYTYNECLKARIARLS